MFRVVLFVSILLLIFATVVGYIANTFGWLPADLSGFYNSHFSFVTGLASVIGLLAFATSNKIKSTDFEKEELEKLQRLMDAASELDNLETNKSQTEQQLLDLERKKKLMELSVHKAGMVLFYRHQLERYGPLINQKIKQDKELGIAVKEALEARAALVSLDEEVEKDENTELIRDILHSHNKQEHEYSSDPIVAAGEVILRTMRKLTGI